MNNLHQQTHQQLIRATGVFKSFAVRDQLVEVLKDISLEVNRGQFVIIIGPSGCGKSTLLHTLLGLEPPTAGQVYFDDKSVYEDFNDDQRSDLRKTQIGMVYQQPNWIKSLTALENVMFALRLTGLNQEKSSDLAEAALSRVGLENWRDYIPTELSSGQQQRVALARAIVADPSLIIADEPTGNLDFESGQTLMNLLKAMNKDGKTIIMVTHDLEYLSYADKAFQMLDGKVVKELANPSAYLRTHHGDLKRGQSNQVVVEDLES